jgi:hypothetical protein
MGNERKDLGVISGVGSVTIKTKQMGIPLTDIRDNWMELDGYTV